ncbi:MAG: hypothetical protein M5U34_47715 [Chloroflexi bacterium]|nr:hypothetical protein [Chloroflexota bacterium]
MPWQPQDQEEAIQEALAALQVQLEKKPLKAPRAFLVYALQTLRRTAIDGERKQTAVSRGGDQEIVSWEALHEAGADPLAAPMQAEVAPVPFERRVEYTVSEREVHAKLKVFFSHHLKAISNVWSPNCSFWMVSSPKKSRICCIKNRIKSVWSNHALCKRCAAYPRRTASPTNAPRSGR